MRNEPGDFGPEFVTPAGVQAWLDRLRRARPAAAEGDAPAPAVETRTPAPPAPDRAVLATAPPGRRVLPMASILATVALALAVWAASGFYRVQPDQVGLVLRFGELVETTEPGLNYHWPYPIEFVLLPRVTAVNQVKIGNGTVMQMLTGDENIVEATASISWRVKNPSKFLFNVYDPEGAVKLAGESAVRQIIGLNPIQSGLSDQRQKIADDAQSLLQRTLDSYDAGIQVTQVQLQRVDPPLAVIDAFNDVQRARADQQRARNEAEAYRNDVLPRARAEADRVKQEALVYREQALNKARSDAERFNALQASFAADPDLTARRLYLDAMEEVLKSAGKIFIDPSGGSASPIVPYLPLPAPPTVLAPQAGAQPVSKATP
ncbi:protease FtsH subunit HflK [Roseiarcus fermentans]|uniref:Protein HflK n=1 Tax=Roseiarcus fermentans TaxID=1473586 RepID=A0A366FSC7_9HYPH|nr:FtsH protease activity modulator HflK [Roseiarcus fermentans]RBP17583.1 protease FtsH subunit HflK [Roseiarcus fermentans]